MTAKCPKCKAENESKGSRGKDARAPGGTISTITHYDFHCKNCGHKYTTPKV